MVGKEIEPVKPDITVGEPSRRVLTFFEAKVLALC